MFTTGSKLFLWATALSTAAAVAVGASTSGAEARLGVVGLVSIAVAFAFLAGISLFTRDSQVRADQPNAADVAQAAQRPVTRSAWPLAAAVGVAGLVVGAVSRPVVFKVSVVVVLAATVEWMVLAWSDQASTDRAYNSSARRRLLQPLEFPILGAAVLGVVVYSFSRIMLGSSKDIGKVVFIVLASFVLVAGFLFAMKRNVSKSTVAGVCGVGLAALLGVGVASAVQGQRTIEPHPTTKKDAAVCLASGTNAEIDGKATQNVAAKSAVIANIYLQTNGVIIARPTGFAGRYTSDITVPRSAQVAILFHNEFNAPYRITARLGTFGTDAEVVSCTTAVHTGRTAFLSFKVAKSQAASSTPFVLEVPGLAGQAIRIVVP